MINKVTYKDEPTLFNDKYLSEFSVEENMDHRRGSSFYRFDIIELSLEDKDYFLDVEDFEKYLGTWKTNTVIWDDNAGWDSTYSELTRVKQKEVITYEWEEIDE